MYEESGVDQESDRARDLLGRPKPAGRDLFDDPREALLGDGGNHLGRDEAGRDAVHGDA